MNLYPILAFVIVLATGFVKIYRRKLSYFREHDFAIEYRETFIKFSNAYFQSYDTWNRAGQLDWQLYVWLTKNVNQIQGELGELGIIHYIGPFRTVSIPRYHVVMNTLPKFRYNTIDEFDVSTTDDCLLRHAGELEDRIKIVTKKQRNPLVWFKEGVQQVIGIPVYLLNTFGLLSSSATQRVLRNKIYSLFTGIAGLVAFVAAIVTIVGQDKALNWIERIVHYFNFK